MGDRFSKRVASILRDGPTDNPELLSLIDAMRDFVFFLDRWGVIYHANAMARRWRSMEHLAGKSLVELEVSVADPSENHREVMQVIRSGIAITSSETHAVIDGNDFYFRVDKIPSRNSSGEVNGVVIILNDITLHVITKRALQESDARYKAFIDNSADAIWCYDFLPPIDTSLPEIEQMNQILKRSKLVECNERLVKLYGANSISEVLGLPLHVNGTLSSRTDIKQFVNNKYALEGQEFSRVDKYGNRTYLQVSAIGVIDNGFLVRVWGTSRDITEQKRYVDKMEHLAQP